MLQTWMYTHSQSSSRFESSRSASLPYALAVIVIALFVGWLAGVIFRRD